MSEKSNNEIFYEAAAGILGALWDQHPIPVSLSKHGIPKLFPELSPDEFRIYLNTVEWLQHENFISGESETVGKDGFGQFLSRVEFKKSRLTAKGMGVLGQTLGDPGDKESTGQKIVKSLGTGAKDVAVDLVKAAMEGFAKGAMGMG